MIEFRRGDILGMDVDALVNTVNCVGIMGRGIARRFKEEFPANFKAYSAACKQGEVQPGRMFVFETHALTNPRYIINFPTKRHWRGKSRIEDIDAGLNALAQEIRIRDIQSIAIPPLGSGLGGLNWNDVRPRIEAALQELKDVEVIIFEPLAAPLEARAKAAPNMTPGRAALVALMNRYLAASMDPLVTLLELHKLLYFMQEAGQRLNLRYTKASYGPYAENLRHVLRDIEGYYISGYADGGDAPDKQLELVPGAVKDAELFLNTDPEVVNRFDRVANLVKGFESPFGLELLATVHWIATRERATSSSEAMPMIYAWADRKRRFSARQVDIAFETLREKGWLTPSEGPPA